LPLEKKEEKERKKVILQMLLPPITFHFSYPLVSYQGQQNPMKILNLIQP
jgi:hypothetical protein